MCLGPNWMNIALKMEIMILWILILVGVFFWHCQKSWKISSLNFCDSFVALVKVGAKLCLQRLCCLSWRGHFCPQQFEKKVQTFPQHLKSRRLATNSSNKLPPKFNQPTNQPIPCWPKFGSFSPMKRPKVCAKSFKRIFRLLSQAACWDHSTAWSQVEEDLRGWWENTRSNSSEMLDVAFFCSKCSFKQWGYWLVDIYLYRCCILTFVT